MSKAEAYCLVRPLLKRFLKKGQKIYDIVGDDLNLQKLKPPLSREIFESEIKGITKYASSKGPIIDNSISDSDKEAI